MAAEMNSDYSKEFINESSSITTVCASKYPTHRLCHLKVLVPIVQYGCLYFRLEIMAIKIISGT